MQQLLWLALLCSVISCGGHCYWYIQIHKSISKLMLIY